MDDDFWGSQSTSTQFIRTNASRVHFIRLLPSSSERCVGEVLPYRFCMRLEVLTTSKYLEDDRETRIFTEWQKGVKGNEPGVWEFNS